MRNVVDWLKKHLVIAGSGVGILLGSTIALVQFTGKGCTLTMEPAPTTQPADTQPESKPEEVTP